MQLFRCLKTAVSTLIIRRIQSAPIYPCITPSALPPLTVLLANPSGPLHDSFQDRAKRSLISLPPHLDIFIRDPAYSTLLPIEAKNDVQIRKEKMKKHKKRKWRKANISLIRKLAMQREKKEENKLQQLFALWRKRTEAWDPADKIENRLHLARRSGFFVDILHTKGGPLYKP